jgi:hypothetical protein
VSKVKIRISAVSVDLSKLNSSPETGTSAYASAPLTFSGMEGREKSLGHGQMKGFEWVGM